jgi:hypothetical protein
MTGLLTAINTYWDANLVNTVGQLYQTIQKPGATMPYAVFTVIAAPATSRYGGVAFAAPQIQFTARDVGSAAALAKCELIIAALDERAFSISGKQNFFTRRLHDPIPEPADPTEDEQGRDTFGWIVTYEFANT